MNFKNLFLLLWVIFALLDPDSDSGSGSTDPIESGSNPDTDPDPQPYFMRCYMPISITFIIYVSLPGTLPVGFFLSRYIFSSGTVGMH
jgi:hypothetical protein